jgi:two-component system cell cycle response regulator
MADQTILIVDDSELMRAMLLATVEGLGDVVLAEDGKTGLKLALEVNPDLILLDIVLPDIDGFKVCEALKKDDRTKHIPVIVLTGMEKGAKSEIKGLTLGAADYILKPFQPAVVQARVKTQLELVKYRKELEHMAMVDSLTGCFNRRYFMNAADMELSRRKRHMYDLVVAVLDVDYFKNVNDTYGHDAGDAVLKEVVSCIEDAVRYEDTVGRIGGEEFAILLPEANTEGASIVLERVRENIGALEFTHNGHTFSVTASIGLTDVEPDDVTMDAALKRADEALYAAKDGGRDQIKIG